MISLAAGGLNIPNIRRIQIWIFAKNKGSNSLFITVAFMWWSGNSFNYTLCAVMSKWHRHPQGAYQNDRRNIYEDVCICSDNCCYSFGCLTMLLPDAVRRRGRSLDWTAFVICGSWQRTKIRKFNASFEEIVFLFRSIKPRDGIGAKKCGENRILRQLPYLCVSQTSGKGQALRYP